MPNPTRPTLKKAREVAIKKTTSVSGVADFLSKDQQNELKLARARGQKKHAKFDAIDAYAAEITARFGYETYLAWNSGKIANKKIASWIYAERTREKIQQLEVLNTLVSAIAGANNPDKSGHAPKSFKAATKNLKRIANEIREISK